MPVYLCKPGWSSPEPWRHGVQVYAYPFRIDDDAPLHHRSGDPTAAPGSSGGAPGSDAPGAGAGVVAAAGGGGFTRGRTMEFQRRFRGEAPLPAPGTAAAGAPGNNVAAARPGTAREASDGDRSSAGGGSNDGGEERDDDGDGGEASPSQSPDRAPQHPGGGRRRSSPRRPRERLSQPQPSASASASTSASSHDPNPVADAASAGVGVAVRRVRHAEVVLVDEVSAAHGRYWLRLRWPGPRGGVAGYIALGPVRPDDVLAGKLPPSSAEPGEEGKPVVIAQGAAAVAAAAAAGGGSAGRQFALRTQTSEVSDNPATPTNSSHRDALRRGGSDDSAGVVVRRQTAQNEVGSGVFLSAAAAAAAAEASHLAVAPQPEEVDAGGVYDPAEDSALSSRRSSVEEPVVPEDSEDDDDDDDDDAVGTEEDEGLRASDPSPPPIPRCASTGLYFPSSSAMELLAAYDDGLLSVSSGAGSDAEHRLHGGGDEKHSEPVFCRICREGLHDVNYDLDSAGGAGGEGGGAAGDNARRQQQQQNLQAQQQPPPPPAPPAGAAAGGIVVAPNQGAAAQALQAPQGQGQGHPGLALAASAVRTAAASAVITHHPYAENPLLAPCECAGSMAFVHYLCVEQWRCRSRHPAARDGLNCETCGGLYALPPPPSRPAGRQAHGGAGGGDPNQRGAGVFAEDDWLDAMPPHVLAALRRPHPGWQVGAAVVRRRWLRPVAPVVASPLVALYCRARRSLKKRGVSRRRWACSLCRRRARWKCVRCLRSYYCSRQCQNVSWHIVHKHVCYKPVRFWWSVAVYGVVGVATFPGVLRDPAVYDLGASCLLVSFHAMGVLGGGMATALKRGAGVDIRGRSLELAVVAMTLWLAAASWGCVWGYFGDTSRCGWGMMGLSSWLSGESAVNWGEVADAAKTADVSPEVVGFKENLVRAAEAEEAVSVAITTVSLALSPVLRAWRGFFGLSKRVLVAYDSLWSSYVPSPVAAWICSGTEEGDLCLRMVRNADPDFFAPELGGEGKCASDLLVVSAVWLMALLTVLAGWGFRRRAERRAAAAAQQRRRQGPAVAVGAGPGGWARFFGLGGAAAPVPRNRPRPHQD